MVSNCIGIDLCYELHGCIVCILRAVLSVLQTPVVRIRVLVRHIFKVGILAIVGRETIDLRLVLKRTLPNLCSMGGIGRTVDVGGIGAIEYSPIDECAIDKSAIN